MNTRSNNVPILEQAEPSPIKKTRRKPDRYNRGQSMQSASVSASTSKGTHELTPNESDSQLEQAIIKKDLNEIKNCLLNGADYRIINKNTGYTPLLLAVLHKIPASLLKTHTAYQFDFAYEPKIAEEYGLLHVETKSIELSGMVSKWRIKPASEAVLSNHAIREKFGENKVIILKTPVFYPVTVNLQSEQESKRLEMIALQHNEFQNANLLKDNTKATHRAQMLGCTLKDDHHKTSFVAYEFLPGKDGEKYFQELGGLHAMQPNILNGREFFASIFRKLVDAFTTVHLADNMLHLDISCRNVMFHPETGRVVVIDYGTSLPMDEFGKSKNDPNFDRISNYSNIEAFGGKQGVRDIFTDLYQARIMLIEALFLYIGKLDEMLRKITDFHKSHTNRANFNEQKIKVLIDALEIELKKIADARQNVVTDTLTHFTPHLTALPQKNEAYKAIDYIQADYKQFIARCDALSSNHSSRLFTLSLKTIHEKLQDKKAPHLGHNH